MAAPSTIPPRGHGSAPKFTSDFPRELQHYFKELELLFGPAQVVDNTEKFKSAIFKLYPSSESKCKWTIANMDKLVGEQLRMGILNISDLRNYY
jgi:hypothetical protein